jgi:hypothetical protein
VTFLRNLWALVLAHPLAFVLFIIGVVLTLGGLVWWVLGRLFALLRKVPGGAAVADAASGAVASIATKTGSA